MSKIFKKIGITFLVSLFFVSNVHAGEPHFLSKVNLTNPKPPSVRTYEPGDRIPFQVDFVWNYCGNKGGSYSEGRITNPVLRGRPHSAFSNWKRLATVHDRYTVGELNKIIKTRFKNSKVSVISINYSTPTSRFGNIPGVTFTQPRPGSTRFSQNQNDLSAMEHIRQIIRGYPRDSTYTSSFTAPNQEGVYHFKYQVKVNTPQGDIVKGGVAVFEVKRPLICPPGQQKVRVGGREICRPPANDDLVIMCEADTNVAEIGEQVTFTADASKPTTFNWYDGANTSGTLLRGPIQGITSSIQRTFSSAGNYSTIVKGTDAEGGLGTCTVRVAVGDVPPDEEEPEEPEEEPIVEIILDDGSVVPADRSVPSPKITLEMDRELTNDICVATWTATNVVQCSLVNKISNNKQGVEFNGQKSVTPGSYQVQCLALKDGKMAYSPERYCRTNPDLRED